MYILYNWYTYIYTHTHTTYIYNDTLYIYKMTTSWQQEELYVICVSNQKKRKKRKDEYSYALVDKYICTTLHMAALEVEC